MLRSKFVSQSSLLRTIPGERASKVARKMSPPRGGDISIWENWGHFNLGLTGVRFLCVSPKLKCPLSAKLKCPLHREAGNGSDTYRRIMAHQVNEQEVKRLVRKYNHNASMAK